MRDTKLFLLATISFFHGLNTQKWCFLAQNLKRYYHFCVYVQRGTREHLGGR